MEGSDIVGQASNSTVIPGRLSLSGAPVIAGVAPFSGCRRLKVLLASLSYPPPAPTPVLFDRPEAMDAAWQLFTFTLQLYGPGVLPASAPRYGSRMTERFSPGAGSGLPRSHFPAPLGRR